jgi:Ankyrin repeat.
MTPLMYAVKDNRAALLDRMIDLGADVCARNNVSSNILLNSLRFSRPALCIILFSGLDDLGTWYTVENSVRRFAAICVRHPLEWSF